MKLFPALVRWPEEEPAHPADVARWERLQRPMRLRVARSRVRRAHEIKDGGKRHRAVKRARDMMRRVEKKEAP